jgi:hypothetical protein
VPWRARGTTAALGLMKRTLLIILLLVISPVIVAADLLSPEGTVDFYLEAQKQKNMVQMSQVRDLELQARELLRLQGTGIEPSVDLVRTTAGDLERRFRTPSRITLRPRSCHTGAPHYESKESASVPVFCSRELGESMSESSAFMVRVAKTPRGWRICGRCCR